MKYLFCLLIPVIILSCTNNTSKFDHLLVDVSEFTIDNSVLEDGDSVQILGNSGNISRNDKITFYNLVVVKSLRTGDTINVLTGNYFMADMNDPITRFYSNTSPIGKIIDNASELSSKEKYHIDDFQPKTFKKVLYDTEYIQGDVKEYPAITGNLFDYTEHYMEEE